MLKSFCKIMTTATLFSKKYHRSFSKVTFARSTRLQKSDLSSYMYLKPVMIPLSGNLIKNPTYSSRHIFLFLILKKLPWIFNYNLFITWWHFAWGLLTDEPISCHWSLSSPPKNIRKPMVFQCFQRYRNIERDKLQEMG